MKKIFAILSIGIIWCFLPMLVKAETIPNLNDFVYDTFGHYMNNASISEVEFEYNEGEEVLLIRSTAGSGYLILVGQFDLENSTSSALLITGQTSRWFMTLYDDMFSVNSKYTYYSNYNFQYGTMTYYPMSEWTPPIDFDSIYYSAQIPVPTIDVYMGSDINNPSSGQAVWNASIEFGDNSQYYIQYGYKASFPSYIDVGLASLRGDFSYNYYNYTSTNYIDIVSLESLTTAVNQSKPASYFQSPWQSFYTDYLTQSLMPEFGTQVNAMSSAMLDDAKDYYVDYMLGQIPMYGNRLEIFARYFIIDKENNNRVVVGAWNHWSSKDGSRTKERPSNYIDNVALPGYINTSNDVDYQENSNSFDNLGTSTGVPATVINNNYVPNYPDYPTIASYNKDNLLVSSIDKINELKGFFGEFNDFLSVTFVWVPDWIWALIGIGFSLSIIVFFLRML